MPNGLAAISKVPAAGWGQILAYMAFCEVSQDQSPGTPAAAGDFGFKVLTSSDPEEKTKKLSAELANGRLAMMAIIGMFFQAHVSVKCASKFDELEVDEMKGIDCQLDTPMIKHDSCDHLLRSVTKKMYWGRRLSLFYIVVCIYLCTQYIYIYYTLKLIEPDNAVQDGLTGSAWGDWANYTASPLRAFENELGVQEPVGFWDPAGFTADGSVENFKRRRQTELKHGRISMLATMGYITPETLRFVFSTLEYVYALCFEQEFGSW